MSERSSVFSSEWRRCLAEHYKYVIRNQDKGTEETLVIRLYESGFTEDELRALYMEATMHVDDIPEDFMPDVKRAIPKDAPAVAETTFQPHPAECTCPSCMDQVLDIGHDEEGQPVSAPEEPEEAAGNIFAVAKPESKNDDTPKQKSLF
ncbi:MAG: hypothetical protein KC496_11725 [Anaerolineae bacterium]|nr:hypothetical protein [Anaerolineae bacterium]